MILPRVTLARTILARTTLARTTLARRRFAAAERLGTAAAGALLLLALLPAPASAQSTEAAPAESPSGESPFGESPSGESQGAATTVEENAPPQEAMAAKHRAVLQGLDKITARVSEFEAPIGEPVRFGTFEITVRACKKTPPEEPPESTAYLEIVDVRPDGPVRLVFKGWMFASSPALSAVEHPVYDVWVTGCRPPDPAAEVDSGVESEADSDTAPDQDPDPDPDRSEAAAQ